MGNYRRPQPELALLSSWLSKLNVETLEHPIKQFPFTHRGCPWDWAQVYHACYGYYSLDLSYSDHVH